MPYHTPLFRRFVTPRPRAPTWRTFGAIPRGLWGWPLDLRGRPATGYAMGLGPLQQASELTFNPLWRLGAPVAQLPCPVGGGQIRCPNGECVRQVSQCGLPPPTVTAAGGAQPGRPGGGARAAFARSVAFTNPVSPAQLRAFVRSR